MGVAAVSAACVKVKPKMQTTAIITVQDDDDEEEEEEESYPYLIN
jgi:hypothetical protein